MRAILYFCENYIKPPHAYLGCGFDSLSAIEMIMFGNDTIIGGNNFDIINNSNDGNFVASGPANIVWDGAANIDLIERHMITNQGALNDVDWVDTV